MLILAQHAQVVCVTSDVSSRSRSPILDPMYSDLSPQQLRAEAMQLQMNASMNGSREVPPAQQIAIQAILQRASAIEEMQFNPLLAHSFGAPATGAGGWGAGGGWGVKGDSSWGKPGKNDPSVLAPAKGVPDVGGSKKGYGAVGGYNNPQRAQPYADPNPKGQGGKGKDTQPDRPHKGGKPGKDGSRGGKTWDKGAKPSGLGADSAAGGKNTESPMESPRSASPITPYSTQFGKGKQYASAFAGQGGFGQDGDQSGGKNREKPRQSSAFDNMGKNCNEALMRLAAAASKCKAPPIGRYLSKIPELTENEKRGTVCPPLNVNQEVETRHSEELEIMHSILALHVSVIGVAASKQERDSDAMRHTDLVIDWDTVLSAAAIMEPVKNHLRDLADVGKDAVRSNRRQRERHDLYVYEIYCAFTDQVPLIKQSNLSFNQVRKARWQLLRLRADQAGTAWIHDYYYRDVWSELLKGDVNTRWARFVGAATKEVATPTELADLFARYSREDTLADSDDDGTVDRELVSKKAPYVPKYGPVVKDDLTEEQLKLAKEIYQSVNAILIQGSFIIEPEQRDDGKFYLREVPELRSGTPLEKKYYSDFYKSVQFMKFVERNQTGEMIGCGPIPHEGEANSANQTRADVIKKIESLKNELPHQERVSFPTYLAYLRSSAQTEPWFSAEAMEAMRKNRVENTDPKSFPPNISGAQGQGCWWSNIVYRSAKADGVYAEVVQAGHLRQQIEDIEKILTPHRKAPPIPDYNIPHGEPNGPDPAERVDWVVTGDTPHKLIPGIPPVTKTIQLFDLDHYPDIDWKALDDQIEKEKIETTGKYFPAVEFVKGGGADKSDLLKISSFEFDRQKRYSFGAYRVDRKILALMRSMSHPHMLPMKDGKPAIPVWRLEDSLSADGALGRSIMLYADFAVAINQQFSDLHSKHMGGVVVWVMSWAILGRNEGQNISHACRLSTTRTTSFVLGFTFVDSVITPEQLPKSCLPLWKDLPNGLAFALGWSMRSRSVEAEFLKHFNRLPKTEENDLVRQIALINLQNEDHVLSRSGEVPSGHDYEEGVKFRKKPEKLLIEAWVWALCKAEDVQRLVSKLWAIFPNRDRNSELWRQTLAASCLGLEAEFTSSGNPSRAVEKYDSEEHRGTTLIVRNLDDLAYDSNPGLMSSELPAHMESALDFYIPAMFQPIPRT